MARYEQMVALYAETYRALEGVFGKLAALGG
jgi:hypothetical protein